MIEEVFIPDLDRAAEKYRPPDFTAREIAIMQKYYGRVSMTALLRYVRHAPDTIRKKAVELGLEDAQVTAG